MSSARRREADHILKLCLGDHLRAYEVVERQLRDLALRAQLMLAAAGLAVLAAGFFSRTLSAAGPKLTLAAAVAVLFIASAAVLRVLRFRWLSKEIDDEPVVTLLRGIEIRDHKARQLKTALLLFALGFVLYAAAAAQPLP
jgi:hypothetical protein